MYYKQSLKAKFVEALEYKPFEELMKVKLASETVGNYGSGDLFAEVHLLNIFFIKTLVAMELYDEKENALSMLS